MLKSLCNVFTSRCVSQYVYGHARFMSSKTEAPNLGLKKTRRVGDDGIKVTLLQGEEISIVSLTEANKISRRRDMRLVKIVDLDTKTQRPVYKLMSASEYHNESVKKRSEQREARKQPHLRSEKLLHITGNTAKHDAEVKIKKAVKWLLKYHEARVILSSDGKPYAITEEVFAKIQEAVKDIGQITQKQVGKGSSIKFQIKPDIQNIEKLKQDPEFLKKHSHLSESDDIDLENEDDEDDDSPVIEVNVTSPKESSFISKS